MQQIVMRKGDALPDRGFNWFDQSGAVIPFSTGYTFQLKFGLTASGIAIVTLTSGITGADTLPNVTVSWTAGWDASLSAETEYIGQLEAIRTTGGKPRRFPDFTLWLTPAMT